MRIRVGTYVTDNSDLQVEVHRVHYQNDVYVKLRASLVNKKNHIVYEMKNYKIEKSNIKHWRKT